MWMLLESNEERCIYIVDEALKRQHELRNKPAHAVPLATSARQRPENQKENQAGHSPVRRSARWRIKGGRLTLGSQPEG